MTLVQTELKKIYLGQNVAAMQGPCPTGFHVPTSDELTLIVNAFTGWNLDGTYIRSYLKIPYSGYLLWNTGQIDHLSDERVSIWSSTSTSANYGKTLQFGNGGYLSVEGVYKAYGYPIRPFKNTSVTPDNTWTTLYGTLSSGIFHNSTDGLISLSSDGTNWITMSDKNLGATVVYNVGDTLSEANCGKFYQWGNNYGFPYTGAVTTSNTQVDASNYGPGNYYSSSTFITQVVRDNPINYNLRGGVSGTTKKIKRVTIRPNGTEKQIRPEIPPYLCFTANTAGSTVTLNKTGSPTDVTLETSTNGSIRTTYTIGNTITLSNVGDKVYWRNTSETDTGFSTSTGRFYKFAMSGSINGSGDLNYLLNKNSTTTLSNYCYIYLFQNCSALKTAPLLPATTLGTYCYYDLFMGCGIVEGPELPAMTLTEDCYSGMFQNCTSLINPPELPATTLGNYCYMSMFNGCTSLEKIHRLPVLTLTSSCYNGMYANCSKIKISTTKTGIYQTAYRIPITGTGTAGSNSFKNMLYNTGGTYKSDPSINTTYYTSNTLV